MHEFHGRDVGATPTGIRPALRLALALMASTGFPVPAGAADFADDFETGQVFAGAGGKWSLLTQAPGASISAANSAAHRGSFGLEIFDNDTTSGTPAWIRLDAPFPSPASYYIRYWFRY